MVRFGGRSVLDGLTLQAETGALTAVLGPNGAGKTTLIRCCTNLIRPSVGAVEVLGQAAGSRQLAGRIGLMPQSAGSWSGIKAVELLRYLAGLGLHLHARLQVTEKGPFEGPIHVRVQGDRRTHSLSRRVTDHIYVAVGTPQQRR